jgi:DNA-binding NarL/FixJ family response regulator
MHATATATNVHIMHTDSVMEAGLCAILSKQDGFTVSGRAQCLAQGTAEVIVADYDSGITASAQMQRDRNNHAPFVLIVTELDKEWDIRVAMESGVHGYLLQGCSAEELVRAVSMLSQGIRYLSESVTRRVADSLSRESLTNRENDVLQLLAQGCCNKLIARALGIGVGTVKTHVKGLMSKLNATARTHAVAIAVQRGLIRIG